MSNNRSNSDSHGLNLGLLIPQSILLQVGTVSVIMLVLAQKTATDAFTALGQASEELLRGERLPILDFPNQTNQSTNRN
ncbi:hypothetical protein NIES4071_67150 [Calothrix sp. NIES-4071]|nr:hypothetical protein NIES4071_67150 [Calothrix sp. NIES-4071]BAZ60993.1 hypothetical protein NIES4105_67110 [Calothrix sp. NIES-4105]